MNKQQENINKLKSLEEYSKLHTVKETEDYIRQLFPEDEFRTLREDINEAYYDYHSETIFIPAGGYFSIKILKGLGDIFGTNHTHDGTDIFINSLLDNREVCLFCEDHFEDIQLQKFLKNSNESVDLEKILNYFKENNNLETAYLYNCLPSDIKNNREVIRTVLNIIDIYAAVEHSRLAQYYDISPYGGLDVEVLDTREIFFSTINEFDFPDNEIYEEEFKKVFLSSEDNLNYVLKKINYCNQMIYIAEHGEEYRHNYEIDQEIRKKEYDIELYQLEKYSKEKKLNIINEKIEQTQTKIDYLNDSLLDLKSKKYNFITQFTQKLKDLQQLHLLNKEIKEFEEEKENYIFQQEVEKISLDFYKQQVSDLSNSIEELCDKQITLDYGYIYNDITEPYEELDYDFKKALKNIIENYEYFKQEKDKWESFIKSADSYDIEPTYSQEVSNMKLDSEIENEEDMEME